MKTISILLFVCFLVATITKLNAQQFEWAKSFGGTSDDFCYSIAVDASGNVYTTGCFWGIGDFDPGAGTTYYTSAGGYDVFVQKMDASGNLIWAKSFGGTSSEYGFSITADTSGNVYITGIFLGSGDFNPGPGTTTLSSAGYNDVFVQKMDASGNFMWAKSFGGTSSDFSKSISVDNLGNVYTTGFFEGSADFDPGAGTFTLTAAGSHDIFIQKMDSSSNFLWAKSFGGINEERSLSIDIDVSGNVYTVGYFAGTGDFDPGAGTTILTSAGGYDVFVQKMDALGNFMWAKSFGSISNDWGCSISIDASGNVYTTGYFAGTGDFDPGAGTNILTSVGDNDIFVQKMDSSGNFLWAKSFGGLIDDQAQSISTDTSGNVYTTGFFMGTVDFDPGAGITYQTSTGNYNVFVQKMDASGNFDWVKSFGGTFSEYGYSIAVDASGNVYSTGHFMGTVDFDPGAGTFNLTAAGATDIYVHKIRPCYPITSTDLITACNSYTWIDGNTYTSSNNTATYNLHNAAGCDSVVTLNLTINTVSDTTTTLNGITITANNISANYQWLDCNNSFSPIAGETNQSFTAIQNGSYSVEITENGCTDTSSCVAITNIGILENDYGDNFKIYPNPTTGNVSIELGNVYQNTNVSIYNMTGNLIDNKSFYQTQILILPITAPAGAYVMRISSGDKKAVIRLTKE